MVIQTTKTVILKTNAKNAQALTSALENLIEQESFADCIMESAYDNSTKEASFAFTGSEASLAALLPQVEKLLPEEKLLKRFSRAQLLKASAISAFALSLVCFVFAEAE